MSTQVKKSQLSSFKTVTRVNILEIEKELHQPVVANGLRF